MPFQGVYFLKLYFEVPYKRLMRVKHFKKIKRTICPPPKKKNPLKQVKIEHFVCKLTGLGEFWAKRIHNVARSDADPVSGAFSAPGAGIRSKSFPDPGSGPYS
jgi:hypothetical protein